MSYTDRLVPSVPVTRLCSHLPGESFLTGRTVSAAPGLSKMCHLLHLAATEVLVDDQCVIKLLKGLCLKHLGNISEAEGHFNYIYLK